DEIRAGHQSTNSQGARPRRAADAARPRRRGDRMRRREFIAGVIGVAASWPMAARAQPSQRVRRIGALMGWAGDDPQFRSRIDALLEGLAGLGWTEGRNLRLDVHWSNGDVARAQALARTLVEQQPDLLLAATTPSAAALQRETRTIPIVFAVVSD